MKHIQYILYTLCALVLFISCTNDNNSNTPSTGKVPVTFSVTLPEPEEVLTRATYTDKDIKNLTVLVFDNNKKFMERIDVNEADITATPGGIKFNIVVDATAQNRTLHLIANARTPGSLADRIDFTGLATTKTEAQIIPQLATNTISGTTVGTLLDNITPLIMWSQVTLNGVNITTVVNGVKLLRSVACVTVKKASTGSGLADLTIAEMAIHNGIGRGNVAPSAYTAATITTPSTGNPYTASAFDYTKAWSTGAEPVAYIYERNCSSTDYMSVILKASYKGQAGYYKIALVKNDTPINIVRNHRYNISILSVNGAGYASVATAISSAPSNALKVSITDETENFPYVKADSQYWMGLSNNTFQLISQANTLTSIELCTVYSSRGETPVLTAGNATALTALSAQPLGGNKYKVTGTFNGTPTNNTLTVRCDNLALTMDIQWSTLAAASGFNQDTDSYAFNAGAGLQNWKMWIPNPTTNKYIHLHPTNGNASALTANAGSGMVTELTGKYGGNAYVHVQKTAGRKDEFWTSSSTSAGVISAKKIIIAQ